jgi:hypothetical protein
VKSPSSHTLILNQLVLDVIGAILEGSAYHFDLHHTEAGRLHPGEPGQNLHRDTGPYPFKNPCPPMR